MAFYGNISNEGRTILTFDKIYNNKKEMDTSAESDGIFIGRFALVSYRGDEFAAKESEEYRQYLNDFNTDKGDYKGPFAGYNGTVWVKQINSDGTQYYKRLANLDSENPEINLREIAPAGENQDLIPPTITAKDNLHYDLNLQGNWGFRVQQINGKDAINFNEAGFNPGVRQEENGTNEIKLSEASSDTLYYLNTTDDTKVAAKDIKELSINLPAIGNAISQMWDIVYNKPGNGKDRNTHHEWESDEGVRMVTLDESGYSYDATGADTLAGVINSAHDLMGKIISNKYKDYTPDQVPLGNIDANKIYYFNKKFYIKEKGYEWVEDTPGTSPYREILLADNYTSNKYYLKTLNGDYEQSTTEDPLEGVTYYKLEDIDAVALDPAYESGKYYYFSNGNYLKDTGSTFDERKDYYKNLTEEIVADGQNTFFFVKQAHTQIDNSGKYKGLFYQENGVAIPCTDKTTGVALADIENKKPFIGTYTLIEAWLPEEGEMGKIYKFSAKKENITLKEWDTKTKYYKKQGEDYIYVKNLPENYYNTDVDYYTISGASQIKNFYEPNKYYYSDKNNYRFATGKFVESYKYFTLSPVGPYEDFYRPGEYYYLNKGNYILDNKQSMTANRTYYEYSPLYVHPNNQNNNFRNGSLWNTNLDKGSFEDLVLGYRYKGWQLKELEGFAHNINTLHGLIIEMNKLLKNGDTITRDNSTIQGCINIINDTLANFKNFTPGEFVTVNPYGQIHSIPLQNAYLTSDDTETLGAKITKLNNAINTLNGNASVEGSVANSIAEIVEVDGGAIDKLKEISKWIVDEDAGAAKIISDLNKEITRSANKDNDLQNQVDDINNTIGSIDEDKTIAEVIAAAIKKAEEELAEEVKRATTEEKNLNDLIDALDATHNKDFTDITNLIGSIPDSKTVKDLIDDETDRALLSEQSLSKLIADEAARAIRAEEGLAQSYAQTSAELRDEIAAARSEAAEGLAQEIEDRETAIQESANSIIDGASETYNTLKKIEEKITDKSFGLEQADYTLNSRCNTLDVEVKNLINNTTIIESGLAQSQKEIENLTSKITELYKYIEALEEKIQKLEE